MILKYLERLIFNVTTRKDSCGSEEAQSEIMSQTVSNQLQDAAKK